MAVCNISCMCPLLPCRGEGCLLPVCKHLSEVCSCCFSSHGGWGVLEETCLLFADTCYLITIIIVHICKL